MSRAEMSRVEMSRDEIAAPKCRDTDFFKFD